MPASRAAQARGAARRWRRTPAARRWASWLMTRRISAVAVCRSSASCVSLNSRAFWIAITAWSAKVLSSACSLGLKPSVSLYAAPMSRDTPSVPMPRPSHSKRRGQIGAVDADALHSRPHVGRSFRVVHQVVEIHHVAAREHQFGKRSGQRHGIHRAYSRCDSFSGRFPELGTAGRRPVHAFELHLAGIVDQEQGDRHGREQPLAALENLVEHRAGVGDRPADELQHLGGRLLRGLRWPSRRPCAPRLRAAALRHGAGGPAPLPPATRAFPAVPGRPPRSARAGRRYRRTGSPAAPAGPAAARPGNCAGERQRRPGAVAQAAAPVSRASISQGETSRSNACALSLRGSFAAATWAGASSGCSTSSTRRAPSNRAVSATMAACSAAPFFSLPRRSGSCARRSSCEANGARVLEDLACIAGLLAVASCRVDMHRIIDDINATR